MNKARNPKAPICGLFDRNFMAFAVKHTQIEQA
jgi:hypothetical protein